MKTNIHFTIRSDSISTIEFIKMCLLFMESNQTLIDFSISSDICIGNRRVHFIGFSIVDDFEKVNSIIKLVDLYWINCTIDWSIKSL